MQISDFKELSFDESSHTYKLNGFVIPSVSEIMKPLSSYHYKDVDEDFLAHAADRGTKIHSAIENYLLFGVEDIPAEYIGYFEAAKSWIDACRPEVIRTEARVYHKVHRYAGTADLPCYIYGVPTIIDFKSTQTVAEMLTRVQLEAYKQAFSSHQIMFERKIIVQVKKDGTYRQFEMPQNDIEAWKVFVELLDVNSYIKKYR